VLAFCKSVGRVAGAATACQPPHDVGARRLVVRMLQEKREPPIGGSQLGGQLRPPRSRLVAYEEWGSGGVEGCRVLDGEAEGVGKGGEGRGVPRDDQLPEAPAGVVRQDDEGIDQARVAICSRSGSEDDGAGSREETMRSREVGRAATREERVSADGSNQLFRLAALRVEGGALCRAFECDFRGHVATCVEENPPAEHQGFRVRLEGEGAVKRRQGPTRLPQAVCRVAQLVPHHGQIRVEIYGRFERAQGLAVAGGVDQRSPFQRERERRVGQLLSGCPRPGDRLVAAAGASQQLEALSPRGSLAWPAREHGPVGVERFVEAPLGAEPACPGEVALVWVARDGAVRRGVPHSAEDTRVWRRGHPRGGGSRLRWLAPRRRDKLPPMTNAAGYADFVERHRARLLEELTEFLSIPSISTLPEHAADCQRAASWVAAQLRGLGCPTVELQSGDGGHPIVWAEGPRVPGRPTVLIYGHYDVQPPDPLDEWRSPPFTPSLEDDRIVARGAADDKGQVYCLLKAFEASRGADGRPPVNIRFLIEGEEESGSESLTGFLAREPERTKADAVVVCDVPYFAPGWPAVYTALRGLCYAEITVRTLASDLHSGLYGGAAPNAHEALVRLLSQLKAPNGRIKIDGLYDDVQRPTRAELAAWRRLPFSERKFMKEEVKAKSLTGIQRASVLERLWALPTLEIHGITGGFTGEGAKTVIPAQARAKISLRLVPRQREKKVQRQLAAQVKRLAPKWADVQVRFIHGADPVEVDTSAPIFDLVDRAFGEVVGRATTPVRSGGSIPIVPALGVSGAPVVLTGIGLPDDGLHAPNEKLTLGQLWDGIVVFGRLFDLLGEGSPA